MEKVKLVIGLGNPGKEYEKTYHNVGFLAVDFFAKNPSISNFSPCGRPPEGKQLPITNYRLLKSNAYMNQSGNFVKAALKKYKIKPEEILIFHDDSDIELGKYKISFGRGSAGHKGVQSIINNLKTKNFQRLRIGVRPTTQTKAIDLVLKKISKKDLKVFEKLFSEINNDKI